MPVSVVSESLLQTKVATEHVLMTTNSGGVFIYHSDCTSFVLGDAMILRAKTVIQSAYPQTLLYFATYTNCQFEPLKSSVPVVTAYPAQFTMECTSSGVTSLTGTGSNGPVIAWRIDNIN